MAQNKPLILITNDDGIKACGIFFLAEAVKEMGEVYIVAPDDAQSGQSSAMSSRCELLHTLSIMELKFFQ